MVEDHKVEIRLKRLGTKFSRLKSIRPIIDGPANDSTEADENEQKSISGFSRIVSDYQKSMESFGKSGDLVNNIASVLGDVTVNQKLIPVLKNICTHVENENDDITCYIIELEDYLEIHPVLEEIFILDKFSTTLPKTLVVGLVIVYDGLVGSLIEECLRSKSDIIRTTNRSIPFNQILHFDSIEDAQEYVIRAESESIIRDNHSNHIEWFQKQMGLKIAPEEKLWKNFIEICERRNLFTHTDGRVNEKYIDNCKKHKIAIPEEVKVGKRLTASRRYYMNAVDVFFEIGIKLGMVCWRSLDEGSTESADKFINQLGFELIKEEKYELAQSMLEFAIAMPKISSERRRRMFCVNLANAYKLDQKIEKSNEIINKYDWSASSHDFQISIAAIKDDVQTVCSLMKNSPQIDREDFHKWPVFNSVKRDPLFLEAYKEIYGISFEADKKRSDIVNTDTETVDISDEV